MKLPIRPKRLPGPWRYGWALDLHTESSKSLGGGVFDTVRTPLGEALYRLKYQHDRGQLEPISSAAAEFIMGLYIRSSLSCIIPVPPSHTNRPVNVVSELANRIGERVQLPVALDYVYKTKATRPLKEIDDPESRKAELKSAFAVKDQSFAGQYVLLLDDLFRSGETLSAITTVLHQMGNVKRVYVLTITKTRTRR